MHLIKEGENEGLLFYLEGFFFFNNEEVLEDKNGRYIMVIGIIGDNRFTFMNLYAPNEDFPNFLKKIASKLVDEGEGIIVVGGDYNCVLRVWTDCLLRRDFDLENQLLFRE